MPTTIETATAIQGKVLSSIEVGQKAFVDSVKAWSETVEAAFSKLPELAFSPPAKPSEILESGFAFTEKVLASQREFASKVYEAALPATKAPTTAAKSAASRA